jgi:hypothetical protein
MGCECDHQRLVAAGQETPRKDVEAVELRLQGIPKVSDPRSLSAEEIRGSKCFGDDVRTTTPRLVHRAPLTVSFLNRGFRVGNPRYASSRMASRPGWSRSGPSPRSGVVRGHGAKPRDAGAPTRLGKGGHRGELDRDRRQVRVGGHESPVGYDALGHDPSPPSPGERRRLAGECGVVPDENTGGTRESAQSPQTSESRSARASDRMTGDVLAKPPPSTSRHLPTPRSSLRSTPQTLTTSA